MATPLVVCDRQFRNRSIHSCIVMPPPPGPARPAASSVRRHNTIGAFSPQRSRNSATSAANSTCTNASNTAIIAAPAGTPPRARNKNSAPTNPDVTFLASRASTWSRWLPSGSVNTRNRSHTCSKSSNGNIRAKYDNTYWPYPSSARRQRLFANRPRTSRTWLSPSSPSDNRPAHSGNHRASAPSTPWRRRRRAPRHGFTTAGRAPNRPSG